MAGASEDVARRHRRRQPQEIHTGKSVAGAWTGCDPTDLDIIDDNPHFELYDPGTCCTRGR